MSTVPTPPGQPRWSSSNFLLVSNVGLVLLLMMSLWSQLNQKADRGDQTPGPHR